MVKSAVGAGVGAGAGAEAVAKAFTEAKLVSVVMPALALFGV